MCVTWATSITNSIMSFLLAAKAKPIDQVHCGPCAFCLYIQLPCYIIGIILSKITALALITLHKAHMSGDVLHKTLFIKINVSHPPPSYF